MSHLWCLFAQVRHYRSMLNSWPSLHAHAHEKLKINNERKHMHAAVYMQENDHIVKTNNPDCSCLQFLHS